MMEKVQWEISHSDSGVSVLLCGSFFLFFSPLCSSPSCFRWLTPVYLIYAVGGKMLEEKVQAWPALLWITRDINSTFQSFLVPLSSFFFCGCLIIGKRVFCWIRAPYRAFRDGRTRCTDFKHRTANTFLCYCFAQCCLGFIELSRHPKSSAQETTNCWTKFAAVKFLRLLWSTKVLHIVFIYSHLEQW